MLTLLVQRNDGCQDHIERKVFIEQRTRQRDFFRVAPPLWDKTLTLYSARRWCALPLLSGLRLSDEG